MQAPIRAPPLLCGPYPVRPNVLIGKYGRHVRRLPCAQEPPFELGSDAQPMRSLRRYETQIVMGDGPTMMKQLAAGCDHRIMLYQNCAI